MNIVFILPSLRKGGSEKIFTQIIKNWPETDNCKLIILEEIYKSQIQHYGLPQDKIISLNKKRVITSIFSLYKQFIILKPNVVFSTFTHVNIIVLLISFFYKTKYIIRESSVFSVMSDYTNKQRLLIRYLMKIFYPLANTIICQSADIESDFKKILRVKEKKYIIINNAIDVSKIPIIETSFADETLSMIYVARFKPVKGHVRLINILKHVNRPFTITLFGEGPMLDELKELVAENHLQGKVKFTNNEQLFTLMKKCDLYIQTSYVEGFPNALLEACAVGLPAIAYNVPGGTKEIINSKNGILIKNGEALKFAEAIDLFNSSDYNHLAIRKDIQKRFSVEKMLKSYIKLAEDVEY